MANKKGKVTNPSPAQKKNIARFKKAQALAKKIRLKGGYTKDACSVSGRKYKMPQKVAVKKAFASLKRSSKSEPTLFGTAQSRTARKKARTKKK